MHIVAHDARGVSTPRFGPIALCSCADHEQAKEWDDGKAGFGIS